MNNQESTNNSSNETFEPIFESVSEFKTIQVKKRIGFWMKDPENLRTISVEKPLFSCYMSKKSKVFPFKRKRFFILTKDFILYKKVKSPKETAKTKLVFSICTIQIRKI